jgi:serine/threonine protein kinase
MNDDEILARMLELPKEARASFLEQKCRGNPDRRSRIEALLARAESPHSFLSRSPMGIESTGTFEKAEYVSAEPTIGPYKLLEPIGEGGMGVVYVAEQSKPVKRKVALKVIKPGMDSKGVVARFQAERQALAMMDHPSIGKVSGAGMTDNGRSYFAMELINGAPITQSHLRWFPLAYPRLTARQIHENS